MKCALYFSLLSLFLFCGCTIAPEKPPEHPSGLNVTEIKPNRDSQIMKQNVLHLSQVFDLSPFLYTKNIHIKTDAIPQSHPVLTLNIRYTNYPNKILASFLHEEFHWWALMKKKEMALAVKDLKKIFPNQTINTHVHIIVCYLEYEAVKFYLGETVTKSVFDDFIRKDKVRAWIYSQVLVNGNVFRKILLKYKLVPPPLA